jgi:hypothetical protein
MLHGAALVRVLRSFLLGHDRHVMELIWTAIDTSLVPLFDFAIVAFQASELL